MNDLETRVAQLERQIRRQRRLGGAALIALAALVSMGQAEEDIDGLIDAKLVRAHGFKLIDLTKSERAALSFGPDASSITVMDPTGTVNATLTSTVDGSSLTLLEEYKARVSLGAEAGRDGVAHGLVVRDRVGQPQIELRSTTEGLPLLRLLGDDRWARASIAAYDQGGRLTLHDRAGAPRIILAVDDTGPHLRFITADEEIDVDLHGSGDGPALRLTDVDGAHAHLGTRSESNPDTDQLELLPASSLLLADADEKRWQAPEP